MCCLRLKICPFLLCPFCSLICHVHLNLCPLALTCVLSFIDVSCFPLLSDLCNPYYVMLRNMPFRCPFRSHICHLYSRMCPFCPQMCSIVQQSSLFANSCKPCVQRWAIYDYKGALSIHSCTLFFYVHTIYTCVLLVHRCIPLFKNVYPTNTLLLFEFCPS